MDNPYDVHTWSRLYREERLAEARRRHLARGNVSRPFRATLLLVMVALVSILLGAAGCTNSASPVSETDAISASTATSESDSPAVSAGPSDETDADSSNDDTNAASPSTEQYTASPDASTSGSSATSDAAASNYAGMRSSGSWECYTFYSDGSVELRHGGTSTVNDRGSYQGDAHFGEIVWDSGRWTSTVVAEGDGLIVDDLEVSPVDSCF